MLPCLPSWPKVWIWVSPIEQWPASLLSLKLPALLEGDRGRAQVELQADEQA